MVLTDLSVDTFLALRDTFFNENGTSRHFSLRDKKNTQDDPLDEFIATMLQRKLVGISSMKSPGPLTSPDLVVFRDKCEKVSARVLRNRPDLIIAIEVKKLERMNNKKIARSTGLDFNTTPPCGTIRIYDQTDVPLDIRSFYLFLCQEKTATGKFFISSLSSCDGNLLNDDFNLYLNIVGRREKDIGLGTYGDGANRNRPMLIFSNPLGAYHLDHTSTLISRDNLSKKDTRIKVSHYIDRTTVKKSRKRFFVHKKISDIPSHFKIKNLLDPFPQPKTRVNTTQGRGKFRIPINLSEGKK